MATGLTSEFKNWYLKPMVGMNDKREDLELGKKNVELAQNCRFEPEPGAVTKRSPISYFNTSATTSNGVKSLFRFYTSGGVKKWVKIEGTKAYVGSDSAGTFTSIRSSLSAGKKAGFAVYKDLLMCGNGYDNVWVYDGSSDNVTWELGSCKAYPGVAGSISKTTVSYQVVPVTVGSVDNICDAVSNVLASVVSQKVELTSIPLGPTGTTARKIYRKDSGTGGAYKLLTTISDNSTTTYTDNSNTVPGAAIGSTTNDMPLGNMLKMYRERLFISGDPSNPSFIYYSNPYLPHMIQITTELDYMKIEPNDNDEIMGIPIQLGLMVCIKKNTIRPLHITSPVSGQSPTTWYAEDPRVWSGTPAQWSVVQTPYGVAYLGWDHWYMYNGAASSPIIDQFDTNDILPAEYSNVVAHMDKGDLVWTYTERTSASQIKSRVMRWNFKRKALSTDVYVHSGVPVGIECFASRDGDDENNELFMGDTENGYVYKTENSDIVYALTSKAECNAGTKVNIFVGGTDSSPHMQIGASVAASAIPTNICILWDNPDAEPADSNGDSSGWTEITTLDGKYVKIDTGTQGTTGTAGTTVNHASQVSDDTTAITYVNYRLFYKNASTTEYIFPDGAIIMWDQISTPTGFLDVVTSRYVKINSDLSHFTGTDYIWIDDSGSGTAEALDNYLEFRFIKKIGETDTWDGLDKYCYTLWYSTAAPGNDWTDVSSTYDNYFLKTAESGPTEISGGDTAYDVDMMQMPSVVHTYSGGTNQSDSVDGDDDTSQNDDYNITRDSANGSISLTSQHVWETARTVTSIVYKITASGMSSGFYSVNGSNNVKVEYTTDGETWSTVGALADNDGYSASGGGSTTIRTLRSLSLDGTYSTPIADCKGIRATASVGTNASGGAAHCEGAADIYTIEAYAEPYDTATFHLAKKILGKMKAYNAAIGTQYTSGTWTAPSMQISADTLKKLYWNETNITVGTTNVLFYTRTGATQVACEAASWSASLTEPNGSDIASTANVWLQYKIELSALDTRTLNPKVYSTNGYVVKYNYTQRSNDVDDTVEFRYKIGKKNFDLPMVDKIMKKIATLHDASEGSYLIKWETENTSGSFTVDLTTKPKRWDSFFPSDAMGKDVLLEIYKNDNYDFVFKEIQLLWTPEPIIV